MLNDVLPLKIKKSLAELLGLIYFSFGITWNIASDMRTQREYKYILSLLYYQ